MIVAGFDISSVRLDCCILEDGHAPVLRREHLGKDDPLIERLRRIPRAVENLLHPWRFMEEEKLWQGDIDWVVIEDPGSLRFPDMSRALFTTLGAITASIPAETQIAWRMASEWRHDLGAKNTKVAGHIAVGCVLTEQYQIDTSAFADYDEHELDAIGIACGWARILGKGAER